LKNLDSFAYLGAFSAAVNIEANSSLFPDGGTQAKSDLNLLLHGYGSDDGLIRGGEAVKKYMDDNGIMNTWWKVQGENHTWSYWDNILWNFLQMATEAGWQEPAVTSIRGTQFAALSLPGSAATIHIYDGGGRFMKTVSHSREANWTGGLAPGSYFLRWQKGGKVFGGKYSLVAGSGTLLAR
jgi:hypothetical protein